MRLESKEEKQLRLEKEKQDALETPFHDWLSTEYDAIGEIEVEPLKDAWFAAIKYISSQPIEAWMTNEEPPRLVSNQTKITSMFPTTMASFSIPLIRRP